jgi:hypothetical protein
MTDILHNPKNPRPPVPPGDNAALPEGTLSKPFLGAQGDENRDPPPGAPAPVNPTKTVPNRDQKG